MKEIVEFLGKFLWLLNRKEYLWNFAIIDRKKPKCSHANTDSPSWIAFSVICSHSISTIELCWHGLAFIMLCWSLWNGMAHWYENDSRSFKKMVGHDSCNRLYAFKLLLSLVGTENHTDQHCIYGVDWNWSDRNNGDRNHLLQWFLEYVANIVRIFGTSRNRWLKTQQLIYYRPKWIVMFGHLH